MCQRRRKELASQRKSSESASSVVAERPVAAEF
jgi:hypothetical protein